MSEAFRSFAEMLRPVASTSSAALRQAQDDTAHLQDDTAHPKSDVEAFQTLRQLRLFHATIAEATEAAVRELLADIAAEVLARELQLAPCAIEAIVASALARFAASEPLRVRVHPDEARDLHLAIPAEPDHALRPGDAAIDLRAGYVDVSLGARLATVLTAFNAPA